MTVPAQVESRISVGGISVGEIVTVLQGKATLLDEAIPDSSTDLLVACTIDVSQLKGIVLMSSQDILIETNSGSAPVDTIALLANKPYFWTSDYLAACFSANITGLYVTNSSGSATALRGIYIVDPTA